ncbi:MAG: RsmD family RNA methyltransferase, partial [Steroidobacteraceae bacterium]
ALGIEALSRGAAHVTFVDREPQVARHLAQTLERLGGASDAKIVAEDALAFLRREPQRFDIAFLDPPYAADVLDKVCNALADGWLAPEAYIYLECPAARPLPPLPAGWRAHRSKRAGQVGYHLLHASGAATEVST